MLNRPPSRFSFPILQAVSQIDLRDRGSASVGGTAHWRVLARTWTLAGFIPLPVLRAHVNLRRFSNDPLWDIVLAGPWSAAWLNLVGSLRPPNSVAIREHFYLRPLNAVVQRVSRARFVRGWPRKIFVEIFHT